MFNKVMKKLNEQDLSAQNLKEKAFQDKLVKFAEKILDDAKTSDLSLYEFRLTLELALNIIKNTQETKKLTDIFYVQPTQTENKV